MSFHDGERGEVDVFSIHGGKVIAGEVKTSAGDFTQVQVLKDVGLSAAQGRHPLDGLRRASPIRCMYSCAMSAHCASVSVRSTGAPVPRSFAAAIAR